MADELKYHRILLKLGGESLAGPGGFGIDPLEAEQVAARVQEVRALGVDVAIVIGGGQPVARQDRHGPRHGPRHRRLHGHAGHGDERPGA